MRQPLGQHFLRDLKVIQTIVAAAQLKPTDRVIEIGPGKGVLTQALVERVAHLTCVELDRSLAEGLEGRYRGHAKLTVVQGDILKQDLDALAGPSSEPLKLLGNLPYAITSPIFEKCMAWPRWDIAVFLIQREVAERIVSLPGSKRFGILSLAVQLFAEASLVMQVKPGAFVPPPAVDSSVIALKRRPATGLTPQDMEAFFDLAHGAFAHRRKTIANSLAMHVQTSRAEVAKWLQSQGVSAEVRAETLGLEEYRRLAGPWAIFRRETKLTSPTATSTIPPA